MIKRGRAVSVITLGAFFQLQSPNTILRPVTNNNYSNTTPLQHKRSPTAVPINFIAEKKQPFVWQFCRTNFILSSLYYINK